jgi:hypothetical protein
MGLAVGSASATVGRSEGHQAARGRDPVRVDLRLAPRDGAPREDPKALLAALRDEVLTESAEQVAADALRSAAEPPRPDADADDADDGAEPAAESPARPPTATTELESPARSAKRPHPRRLVPLRIRRRRRRGKRRKPT